MGSATGVTEICGRTGAEANAAAYPDECGRGLSVTLLGVRAVVWLMLPLSVSEMLAKRFLSERQAPRQAAANRWTLQQAPNLRQRHRSAGAAGRCHCLPVRSAEPWKTSAEGAASRRASNCLLTSLSMCACAEKEEHRKSPKAKSSVPSTEREKLVVASLMGFSVFMPLSIKPNGKDVNNTLWPFSGISHAKSEVRACLGA